MSISKDTAQPEPAAPTCYTCGKAENKYCSNGFHVKAAALTESAPGWCKHCRQYTIEEPLQAAPTVVEPWRDHVEQRLRTWRQTQMNRSGDRLALDDFMDKESLDDLIDFVCDEWSGPAATPPRAALPDHVIVTMYAECSRSDAEMIEFARAVEQAHGIGGPRNE